MKEAPQDVPRRLTSRNFYKVTKGYCGLPAVGSGASEIQRQVEDDVNRMTVYGRRLQTPLHDGSYDRVAEPERQRFEDVWISHRTRAGDGNFHNYESSREIRLSSGFRVNRFHSANDDRRFDGSFTVLTRKVRHRRRRSLAARPHSSDVRILRERRANAHKNR